MKPRIRMKRRMMGRVIIFECQGFIPGTKTEGWGYGSTIKEAFEAWRDEPIPF